MDPLNITAGVIATIQIIERIISLCRAYVTSIDDAPSDLTTTLIEVGGVKCVLETLEILPGSSTSRLGIMQKLDGPLGPLEGCNQALKSLEDLFPVESHHPADGRRRRIALSLASLAWPFKRDKARKFLEDIGRYKNTISLALTVETS